MFNGQIMRVKVQQAAQQSGSFLSAFFCTSIMFQGIGFYFLFNQHFFEYPLSYLSLALINELLFTSLVAVFVFMCLLLSARWLSLLLHGILSLILVFQLASLFYFAVTLEPIGATFLAFDADQMEMVASSFVVFKWEYLLLILPPVLYVWLYRKLLNKKYTKGVMIGIILPLLFMPFFGVQIKDVNGELNDSGLAQNKTCYFLENWMQRRLYHNSSSYEQAIYEYHRLEGQRNFEDKNYPLLHEPIGSNPLAPFFSLDETPPNIVYLVVESLSSSFSGKNADALSFTPFLDSLAEHSLYFENTLATGERTFSVLPSIISSLPHGKQGFTAANNNFPEHTSLSKWLFKNQYTGAFFYGGYARFDHMDLYMYHEGFHSIFDRKEYNYEGTGKRTSVDPVPFGIGDRQLFDLVRDKNDSLDRKNPFFDVILTLSMHYPFLIEQKAYYMKKAKSLISANMDLPPTKRKKYNMYIEPFSTMLYTDDAIKEYFKERTKDKSHKNTIYVILGDHMMSDIPQDSPIEKYRVPMLIYSPLLKKTKRINAVNTQLDLAPSLMQLIGKQYNLTIPRRVSWLGQGLNMASSFENSRNVLFMRNNRTCDDFLTGDYFVHKDELYKIGPRLRLTRVKNDIRLHKLVASKSYYEKLHIEVVTRNKLIPPCGKREVLFDEKNSVLGFSDKEEYITLRKQVLRKDYRKLQVHFELLLNDTWPAKEGDSIPLLVCTIKRGDKVYFWEKIDLELLDKPLSEERLIVMNIEENINLTLKKGDEISIFIWNIYAQKKRYRLLFKQFKMSGETY